MRKKAYHCPGLTRPLTVHTPRKFPGVKIPKGCDNGLRCLGSNDEEIGTRRGRDMKNEREQIDDTVNSSEQKRM